MKISESIIKTDVMTYDCDNSPLYSMQNVFRLINYNNVGGSQCQICMMLRGEFSCRIDCFLRISYDLYKAVK